MNITFNSSKQPEKIETTDENIVDLNQLRLSPTDQLYAQIEKGRDGDNWGIPTGLPKMDSYMGGLTPSTYYLIFGPSGAGKTTEALYAFIFKPLYDEIHKDLLYVYFSLEMPAHILYAKLLSMYIAEKTGREISFKEMLSINRGTILSDEDYELVKMGRKWLKSIESKLIIYDKSLNAAKFKAYMNGVLERLGKFTEVGSRVIYKFNNPNLIFCGFLDHYGLLQHNGNLKSEIDSISNMITQFRNICGISFVGISQANRGMSSIDRKKSEDYREPQRSDVKDSNNLEQDCDVMIAIYDPTRDKIKEWRGYDVENGLPKIIRGLILLKNRYGIGDIAVGVAFYGRSGIWRELPKGDIIIDYKPLRKVNGDFSKAVSKPVKVNFGSINTSLREENESEYNPSVDIVID